jgi:hypothetical protein
MLNAGCINSIFNFINHSCVYNKIIIFILTNSYIVRIIYHYLSIVKATMCLRASIVQSNIISDLELRFSALMSRMRTGLEGGFTLS